MDPNKTWERMCDAADVFQQEPEDLDDGYSDREEDEREEAARILSEGVIDLNRWIRNGGELPSGWQVDR